VKVYNDIFCLVKVCLLIRGEFLPENPSSPPPWKLPPQRSQKCQTFDWREDLYCSLMDYNTMQISPQYMQSSRLRFSTMPVSSYQTYKVSEFKREFTSMVPFKNLSNLSYLRSHNTYFSQVFSTVATRDLHGNSLLFGVLFKFSSILLGNNIY